MEQNERNGMEYYSIDVLHIAKYLWQRAWLIAVCSLIAAAIGFCIAAFAVTPKYSSAVMFYVNNSSVSIGSTSVSITSSDIAASQSLVKTYSVLLRNRTTLNEIIHKENLSYTYEELYDMVHATSVNDTEVLQVQVISTDPYEAARIANRIAEVLPERITEIIEGSSMEVVDTAVVNLKKISPSITKYTALGLAIGILLSGLLLAILAVLDDTVHDEDYILHAYDYPILAKVPNLVSSNRSGYGYYYQYRTRDTRSGSNRLKGGQ